jgi:WD40 repeat protein
MYMSFGPYKIILLTNNSFATAYKSILIWDIISKVEIKELIGHTNHVTELVKIEEDILASGSYDGSIKVWNYTSGQLLQTLVCDTIVTDLVSLRNGHLASCSGRMIQIWNQSGQCETTLQGHESLVECITLMADDLLASASLDKTIRVWNLTTSHQTLTLHADLVRCLVLLDTERRQLASGDYDNLIKLWNLETGALLSYLSGHTGSITSLVNLKQGHLASSSCDMTIKIWNYDKYLDYGALLVATLRGHMGQVLSLILLPNGDLVSVSADRTVKVWNLKNIHSYPNRANLIPSVDD